MDILGNTLSGVRGGTGISMIRTTSGFPEVLPGITRMYEVSHKFTNKGLFTLRTNENENYFVCNYWHVAMIHVSRSLSFCVNASLKVSFV